MSNAADRPVAAVGSGAAAFSWKGNSWAPAIGESMVNAIRKAKAGRAMRTIRSSTQLAMLVGAVDNFPAYDGGHDFPDEVPAIEGSVVRQGSRFPCFEGPALFGIEDGHVGVIAFRERAASAEVEDSRGPGGEKLDDAGQRNLVPAMELRNRQRQRRF